MSLCGSDECELVLGSDGESGEAMQSWPTSERAEAFLSGAATVPNAIPQSKDIAFYTKPATRGVDLAGIMARAGRVGWRALEGGHHRPMSEP